MRRQQARIATLVVGLWLAAHPLRAQGDPVVNTTTFESRSKLFALEVDPSQRNGQGGASYRLSRRGHDIWSGELPFTLLDARVSDDGVAVGYSNTGGSRWSGEDKDTDLHLVILDAQGKLRLDEVLPRRLQDAKQGGTTRKTRWPNWRGLVLGEDSDRVFFRISIPDGPETWKAYQLSTGSPAVSLQPASSMKTNLTLSLFDAEPIRGTPLTLVHWERRDPSTGELGARYTLIDTDGLPVWVLDLPREYMSPDGRESYKYAPQPSILDVSRPREFDVASEGRSVRVVYKVESDGQGRWKAVETDRLPYADYTTAPPDPPDQPLQYLGSIHLETAHGAIRNIHDFDLDNQGRFGFARDDGSCGMTFLIAGFDDTSARETALGSLASGECTSTLVAWAASNTWLVTAKGARGGSEPAGWWVNAETGGHKPLELPSGTIVRAIAPRPRGGVVALCQQESLLPFLPSHTLLLWLDAEGRREKGYSEAASPGTAELEAPEGVAVTTSGEVLVVDADRRLVAVFGANGKLRKTIDLEAAWGHKPSYPSGIGMDADGGFIVEDLGAQIPYVRMYADGTLRNALELQYDDGRPTGRLYRVRGGPDGSIWGSSSSALLQLDDDGMVVRAIRDQPDPDELRVATAIALDADDGIYAADSTGAVHVFRSDGTLRQIDRPEPGDVPKALVSPSLAVASDGRVLLGQPGGSVLEFSSAGGRQARYPGDEPLRLWNPASGGFWARRAHEVALLDLKGRTVRTIAKKADRTWLGNVQSLVVAPDGPIAVCGFVRAFDPREHRWSLPDDKTTLSLYSADGTPTAAIEKLKVEGDCGLRPGSYDGRSIAIWDGWDIRIFDVTGKFVARFRPKPRGRDATGWPILLAAGGRELWLFDGVGLILDRYAMP